MRCWNLWAELKIFTRLVGVPKRLPQREWLSSILPAFSRYKEPNSLWRMQEHKDIEKNNVICERDVPENDGVLRYQLCLLKPHICRSDTKAIDRHQNHRLVALGFGH